ncbi:FBP domain-containing protein [Rugosimonospora acidiphila]|uniref:FBP domain-containing protein n=1 Tax=Rugosimonospora acidiphila TaxID=556531 RepID=A0ABP9SPY6_9ACTN
MTEQQIRGSMSNCSRGDAKSMTLPRELDLLDWAGLDFLGWRDPRAPLRGYLVMWRDGRAVGVQLRAAESKMSRRVSAMCSLCRTSQPGNNVSLFAARRAGQSGRDGNTVGTYICADLACCRNARMVKPTASVHPAPGLTVEQRVDGLLARADSFVAEVLGSAPVHG